MRNVSTSQIQQSTRPGNFAASHAANGT